MTEQGMNGKNLAAGIKLVHEEIKGLREDIHRSLKDAAEDRRRADADRERADRRFEFLVETMREERRRADAQFRALMRGVLDVGRQIVRKLDANTEILKENTELLKDIKRGMNGGPGRPRGNGHSRS